LSKLQLLILVVYNVVVVHVDLSVSSPTL